MLHAHAHPARHDRGIGAGAHTHIPDSMLPAMAVALQLPYAALLLLGLGGQDAVSVRDAARRGFRGQSTIRPFLVRTGALAVGPVTSDRFWGVGVGPPPPRYFLPLGSRT